MRSQVVVSACRRARHGNVPFRASVLASFEMLATVLRYCHLSHSLTLLLHVLRIRPDTCCGGCCVLFKCGGPGARSLYIPMIIRDPNTMEPLPSKFGKPKPHAPESSQTMQPPIMSHPLTPKCPIPLRPDLQKPLATVTAVGNSQGFDLDVPVFDV